MSAGLVPNEVKVLLRDRSELSALGVRIAVVQPLPDGGVYVGVEGDPDDAAVELRRRYTFPVACWRFE